MGWSRRIKTALENNSFVFSCQPIISVADRGLYSHELLLRMKDPETGEYIMPGGFFDAAERFGLMSAIDHWVLEHAFDWLNDQLDTSELKYFINLSGKSIGDSSLLSLIRNLSDTLTFPPANVVFEVTESVAISDLENARHFISELKSMGFKTALDDFGVGYSSFSYLRELDVDFVKIDGSFIDTMHQDKLNLALVKAINDVCHILGKLTIAEFVQNEQTMALLKDIGVDYAQGYNIATASDYNQQTIQFRHALL
jgi:EAL domain-containing protein (putative c-di-GMP-specific phosphodiesterase class I)